MLNKQQHENPYFIYTIITVWQKIIAFHLNTHHGKMDDKVIFLNRIWQHTCNSSTQESEEGRELEAALATRQGPYLKEAKHQKGYLLCTSSFRFLSFF